MSWTRRLIVAGLIGVAQAGVVVVLAQTWQTTNAANPPCNVSCTRDSVPACPADKECPPQSCTGSVARAQYVPVNTAPPVTLPAPSQVSAPPQLTELRAVPPPPITEDDVKGVEPSAVERLSPLPPAPLTPPVPSGIAAAAPEVRPVPPATRLQDPDAGALMPTPVAPPPPPAYAAPAPVASPVPVPPENKPYTTVAETQPVAPPPPPAQDPLPPTEPPVQIVTPVPQPQPLPPTQPKQTVNCPWTLRIENIDGRAHLEAHNGKEVQFRVICAELDVQAPRGFIQAVGDVVVDGHELHGTCKKLTINWHDEHVLLDGGVDLKCRKNGEEIEVKGEKLSFRLSVISTVRADTLSDAPVRRAVIE